MNPLIESPEILDVPDVESARATADARLPLTIRTPDELLAMAFDDSDIIIGDRLLALFQSLVIAAQAGAGKSRLLLQLIAAQTAGRKFLGLPTSNAGLRWLVLQTENSNRRLQLDLSFLKSWLGADWANFNEIVTLHTIEHDADGFVSLDSSENKEAIADIITRTLPDIIAVDPLNDFSTGDLNKDVDMRATVSALSRLCRRGNPRRALVVLHHALTGKAGAAKAVGHDRASFARNSKALLAWARGQINIAPMSGENNERLIVACGKASNGREFPPFAVKLNTATMIYECDPSIDVAAWAAEMTGKPDAPLMSPDRVGELCDASGSSKPQLAKAIMEDCGCVRQSAYRYIVRATGKTIKKGKDETFFRM